MDDKKSKPGPKPITGKTLSAAERKQRQRVKQAFLGEAAKDSGYVSMSVLLNERQLLAWGELEHVITNGKPTPLTQEKISQWLFYSLKHLLNEEASKHGLKIPLQADWPQHCEGLWEIEHNAKLKFIEWEKGLSNDNN